MLKIFNDLRPFFEDCYRRVNIREYARIMKISPPHASKSLSEYEREGLLSMERERRYVFFYASKESRLFKGLSVLYWLRKLQDSGLLDVLEKETAEPLIILYGSFSKAEVNKDSDIDIAVFTPTPKTPNVSDFEKKLGRRIDLRVYGNTNDVEGEELLNNIRNGFIISGGW